MRVDGNAAGNLIPVDRNKEYEYLEKLPPRIRLLILKAPQEFSPQQLYERLHGPLQGDEKVLFEEAQQVFARLFPGWKLDKV